MGDDDEDEDEEDENSDDGKKKKKGKEKRIEASRTRDDGSTKKKGRYTKLRKYKVIISHPAMYHELNLKKKDNKIKVVKADWLFDSIEHYKVVGFDKKYIVKPSKKPSESPTH